jgi:hypothetical protein
MFDPWLEEAIFAGVAEEMEEQEAMGRAGEVPRRIQRAYSDILNQREPRVPQSLAGVRGFKAHPLRFGAPTDVAPPNALRPHTEGPLDSTTTDATRVGLDALSMTLVR